MNYPKSMKQEKIVLSFIAVLVGLAVAGIFFFLFQGAKRGGTLNKTITIAKKINSIQNISPVVNPNNKLFLTITKPQSEQVYTTKNITLSGQTLPSATIVIITPSTTQVLSADNKGNFFYPITLNDGENFIQVTAILSSGEEKTVSITATYSLEKF